jgi:hypothetical protein
MPLLDAARFANAAGAIPLRVWARSLRPEPQGNAHRPRGAVRTSTATGLDKKKKNRFDHVCAPPCSAHQQRRLATMVTSALAPGPVVMEHDGFTVANVCCQARRLADRKSRRQ